MKRPLVSVVIPTHRRTSQLRELLGSLERQSRHFEFEVIVVANLPESGLKKVVESHGARFRFFETGRLGANIARNKGTERARGDLIVFLDDDCYVPERDFIERVVRAHADYPQAYALGGRYSLKEGASTLEKASHLALDHAYSTAKRRFDETTRLLGGNWSCKACDGKPRFDDSIALSGSDVELFERLIREGRQLLAIDELSVVHRQKLNPLSFLKRAFFQGAAANGSSAKRSRHWNSTLSLRECAEREGLEWTQTLAFVATVHRILFDFGLSTARHRTTSTGFIAQSIRPLLRSAARLMCVAVVNARDVSRLERASETR